jgi:glycosyltransferase involved in cell wall biosynthesis
MALARGPSALVCATFVAFADACRTSRLVVRPGPTSECRYKTTWRVPSWRQIDLALRRRLNIAIPDFRRRAESSANIECALAAVPITSSILLASQHTLSEPPVRDFLLAKAAANLLTIVRPGEEITTRLNTLALIDQIEPNAEGQAQLLALRQHGIACNWLSVSAEAATEDTPLREACMRQAMPTPDGELRFADIAQPRYLTIPRCRPPGSRPLRVLTYRWHVPHQYELFKLGAEFTLVTDLGEDCCRWWDLGQRPLPANTRFVRWHEIDASDFDLAILHFDENVLLPSIDAPSVGPEWGATFRFLREHLAIPCVAVCHGTPLPDAPTARQLLVEFLDDIPVVVNSHQAKHEWGFKHSRVIWQGFDASEFPCRPKPKRDAASIVTLPSEAFSERPGYRGADLLALVAASVPEPLNRLKVAEPNLLLSGNEYADAKFVHYIKALHAFDIYFNPTLRSPMPRSRGEAMLCGLATVNALSHDVDRFIENGVTGFFSESAAELSEQIRFLLANPARAWRIGVAGREAAIRLFHIDRYLDDWRQLIREALGNDAL